MLRIRFTQPYQAELSSYIIAEDGAEMELRWSHRFRRGELHDVGEYALTDDGTAVLELLLLDAFCELPLCVWQWERGLFYRFAPENLSMN